MKAKIKILHLIDSGGLYGAENVIINLSTGLKKMGHESIVGCFQYSGRPEPEVGTKAADLGLSIAYIGLRNKVDLLCVPEIARFCRDNKVDIVHSHGYKPSLVCIFLKLFYKIPYVVTCHLWYSDNWRLRVYTFAEKLCMLNAKCVVGVSENIITDLKIAGLPDERLILINNGIDVESFSKAVVTSELKLRHMLSLQGATFIIGSLGRLTEQKDHYTFIKAAAEFLKEEDDAEFIIAGDGHLKDELISFSKQLKIDKKFHFIGFQKDTLSLLRLMDIFVLSSLDEGLPIALLEAMAAKRPIVTTPVGAIPAMVKNGINGLLFEKGKFIHLKNILVTLKKDDEKRAVLANNAYKTVRSKYSIDQMTKKYLDVYNNSI